MARTFPAVLVRGILESGKTTFIIDSLLNGDFGDIGRVLVLSTEEGEVEYDPSALAKVNAVYYQCESPEDFTVEKINDLIRVNKPHALFIEENAMWDWENIKLPPYVMVEQTFTIIDATTFKIYFNNMRQKFQDMVGSSDIVIMNRCEESSEMAGYKRSLKLINKNAYFITLGKDGNPVSFVEELPYKIADEMKISDDDFGVFYIDTFDNRSRYEGKIVEFNCMTVLSSKLPENTFVAGRLAMTCCANDIQLIGHLCSSDKPLKLKNKAWAHLRARIHYLSENEQGEPQIILEYLKSEPIAEIENPVVSLQ